MRLDVKIINRQAIYSLALFFFLVWENFVIAVKWKANYLDMSNKIGRVLMVISVILLCVCIFVKIFYTRKRILEIVTMLLVATIIYINIGDNTILFLCLFVYAIQDLNYEKIIKLYAVIQMICVFSILLVFSTGMSENVVSYFAYGKGYSLGTYHANNLGTLVLSCFLAVSYAFLKNHIVIDMIIAIIVDVFLWKTTLSRTNCLLVAMLPVTLIILRIIKKVGLERVIRILRYTIGVVFVGTLILTVCYDQIANIFNDGTFLSRFTFGRQLLEENGIRLFGSKINFLSTVDWRNSGGTMVILDCAYLKLLIYYGIIATVFVMSKLTHVINLTLKNKDYELLFVCVLIIISGITQGMLIGPHFNFAILAAFAMSKRENADLEEVIE